MTRTLFVSASRDRGPSRIPQTLREAWVALAGLSAVFLFEMLDNSILSVALPTIGRDLHASTTGLQWVTGAYSVVFGGLMLVFGALSDRFGRRRVMLVGLVLLAFASLATAFVRTVPELIAVRAAMGAAAAMTTPGSMALAFRLFGDDRTPGRAESSGGSHPLPRPTPELSHDVANTRMRAINLISTVGLVGLAIGPTAGGLVLAVAPWQVLLLVNVPIAALAFVGIRLGVGADRPDELHREPIDVLGAVLGTAAIVCALVVPTLFVNEGARSWTPWALTAVAVASAAFFVWRERTARHPLLDLALVARPLVASGLAYKAAAGMAMAGLGYLVTLQLQLAWGWSPALASLGMLPQVVVLLAGGAFVSPVVKRFGLSRAAWLSASSVVAGLAVYAALGRFGYVWVALALLLVAAGLRVLGVVAGMNVMRGLPEDRTTIGAALTDTASEVTTGVGIAVAGTILAAMFTGDVASSRWSALQAAQFQSAATLGGLALTALAATLVAWAAWRSRRASVDGTALAAFGG